jgi:hypothetical protein
MFCPVVKNLVNLPRVALLACDARCTFVQLRFSAKIAAARYGFRGLRGVVKGKEAGSGLQ